MIDKRTAGENAPDGAGSACAAARQGPDAGALVAGIRRGDDAAVAELYERYLPLLVMAARRHRVLPSDREELALEVLAEVAMQLMRDDTPVPRNLQGLLMTVLRRRVLDRLRREAARIPELPLDEVRDDALAVAHDGEAGRARAGPALVRLADHLEAYVDDTELQILYWLAEHVPQRTIAEWLGMSHGATRMRIGRLRDRLREVVRTYWRVADDDSRAELARFFRRYLNPTTLPPSRGPGRAPGGRRHGSST